MPLLTIPCLRRWLLTRPRDGLALVTEMFERSFRAFMAKFWVDEVG